MSRHYNHSDYPEKLDKPMQIGQGMACAGNRNGISGTGDLLPMVYRDGALDAFALPSRMGSLLVYPGGRVESVE